MRNEESNRPNGLDGGLSSFRFDYNSVSSPVAKFLMGQADRIRRQCATSTIQIGRALAEAKHHLSHGAFLRWVECEVGIPARTAQAYMRVASWSADKGAVVAHLSPSVLYLLSASNTPDNLVTDALKRAEAGEYIASSVLRTELKAFRLAEREGRTMAEMSTAEMSAPRDAETNSLRLAVASATRSGNKLKELVSILFESLSPLDFERVRDIVTSDVVVSEPYLAQSLVEAFQSERLGRQPSELDPLSAREACQEVVVIFASPDSGVVGDDGGALVQLAERGGTRSGRRADG